MLTGIPCTLMRGGTSKGVYFHARDLPAEPELRNRVLLSALGSPDARQIDGLGGAHPLTSKVAIMSPASVSGADVDYLFLQVMVDRAEVSDSQNCGNILAGVGPWAIENGMVSVAGESTAVRVHMVNTGSSAIVHVKTPHGEVEYEGTARIDGVPGTAAPISIEFLDVAGSSCGALLPTGQVTDRLDDIELTCIDNGMPVIIVRAAELGVGGEESPAQLEGNPVLVSKVESIRLRMGHPMKLGDVRRKTVPKICLVGPPRHGGSIATVTFIPHRVHEAIGVLGAVSVATACVIPGTVAAQVAQGVCGAGRIEVEHPSGFFTVEVELASPMVVRRATLLRTARKLLRGDVFVPSAVWSRA